MDKCADVPSVRTISYLSPRDRNEAVTVPSTAVSPAKGLWRLTFFQAEILHPGSFQTDQYFQTGFRTFGPVPLAVLIIDIHRVSATCWLEGLMREMVGKQLHSRPMTPLGKCR